MTQAKNASHCGESTLWDYFLGAADERDCKEIEAHLAICETCGLLALNLFRHIQEERSWPPELHGKAHWRKRVQKGIEIAADGASEEVREKLAQWAKAGVERATGVLKGIWHAPERAGDALYDGVRSVLGGLIPALTRGERSAVPPVLHTRGRGSSSRTQRPAKPRVSLERDLLSVRLHGRIRAAGPQVVLLLFEDAALAPQAALSHWDPSERLWIATFKPSARPCVLVLGPGDEG